MVNLDQRLIALGLIDHSSGLLLLVLGLPLFI
jgi:hypothetical protein